MKNKRKHHGAVHILYIHDNYLCQKSGTILLTYSGSCGSPLYEIRTLNPLQQNSTK